MLLNRMTQFFCVLMLFIISASLSALEITVVDKDGKPVGGAVIGLSSTSIAPPIAKKIAIMDQIDYRFSPQTLVIEKGQWVDFPNSDDVRHHIYSFSSSKPFEIKIFSGSEAPPVNLSTPGIVVLGCNIHDSMVGYIYVADTELTAISDAFGKINIEIENTAFKDSEKSPRGLLLATLWHPLLSPVKTDRISIQIDPDLPQQSIQLDIAMHSQKDQKATNGFSSKFRSGS